MIPFELVSLLKELFLLPFFAPVLQFIWFHTFMDQKYDCFNRDKKPFYWFHVSPYCILWAVSELTIFFYFLIAISWFLINSETRRRKSVFSSAALCTTRMKFIASNMRFHTRSVECFSVPAELHITRNKTTLSFISEFKRRTSNNIEIYLFYAIEEVDTCYFDVFHYWNFYKLWWKQEQH